MTILFPVIPDDSPGPNNLPPVTEPDEICCPICETRHKMSEHITVYTKTLDGRILKSMICPACHITRAFIVEKEGE